LKREETHLWGMNGLHSKFKNLLVNFMANKNNESAVSPIVATLVLIVVAVIGAVAVGTIMGTFSTDVSKQTNAGNAAGASQTQIIVAGTWVPILAEKSIAADFERLNPGINVNVQDGGSQTGIQAPAMGIADIGAVSGPMVITSAQASNSNDPTFRNLYYTQVGGRGLVFIQDASGVAVPGNVVSAADLNALYSNVASDGTEKGIANNFSAATNVTVEQYLPNRWNNQVVFNWSGLPAYNSQNTNAPNAVVNNLGPDMLASVQAGSAAHPAFGYIDACYAFTGGVTSNTPAPGIKIVSVATDTGTYVPKHTNIRNALHDWEYGYAQDTTSGPNYPQQFVTGIYYITKGSSPSGLTGNRVTTPGTSAANSLATHFINFAKSPTEASGWNNNGMYSIYDFM
jgi:phosphate transport system substrate-binding protein